MKQTKNPGNISVGPSKTNISSSTKKNVSQPFELFEWENYKWMLIGLVMIIAGFVLMSGGKSSDPGVFDYKEIYSFRRITLAPIIIIAGFVVEIWAIMKKSES